MYKSFTLTMLRDCVIFFHTHFTRSEEKQFENSADSFTSNLHVIAFQELAWHKFRWKNYVCSTLSSPQFTLKRLSCFTFFSLNALATGKFSWKEKSNLALKLMLRFKSSLKWTFLIRCLRPLLCSKLRKWHFPSCHLIEILLSSGVYCPCNESRKSFDTKRDVHCFSSQWFPVSTSFHPLNK